MTIEEAARRYQAQTDEESAEVAFLELLAVARQREKELDQFAERFPAGIAA